MCVCGGGGGEVEVGVERAVCVGRWGVERAVCVGVVEVGGLKEQCVCGGEVEVGVERAVCVGVVEVGV